MAVEQSTRVISDATGVPVDLPYQVGLVYDDQLYVVDLDCSELATELKSMTLYEVLEKGKRARLRDMVNKRANSVSLNAVLHRYAREWALEHDMPVGRRGVVGKEVLRAYQEAMGLDSVALELPVEAIYDEDEIFDEEAAEELIGEEAVEEPETQEVPMEEPRSRIA